MLPLAKNGMQRLFYYLLFIILIFCASQKTLANSATFLSFINNDSTPKKIDTVTKKPHSPKLALKRSAMIPGWGQVYNKQVWKVPIIYAALGITTYFFIDNYKTYQDIRFAYNARLTKDTPAIMQIKNYLKNLDVNGLNINRRRFRQQIDYSVLFFVAFWGLNMADAVVFAHLKDFDVSDNISGNINIGKSSVANTTGLNLKFDIHKKRSQKLVVVK